MQAVPRLWPGPAAPWLPILGWQRRSQAPSGQRSRQDTGQPGRAMKKLMIGIVVVLLTGCHAPLLLNLLSPDTYPVEEFDYFDPNFKIPDDSLLRTDGFYYGESGLRKIRVTVEDFRRYQETGKSPGGIDLDGVTITEDTDFPIVPGYIMMFFPDGTYLYKHYRNVPFEDIKKDANDIRKHRSRGGSVYQLDGNQIRYETYSQMSGFWHNTGTVLKNAVTEGQGKPYVFYLFDADVN